MKATSPRVLLMLYRDCLIRSCNIFLKNWIIVPASIAMYLLLVLGLAPIFSSFGIAGSLVLGLIITCFFTFFYGWIFRSVRRERLSVRELFEFDYSLFVCIINTGFVLWIIRFFIDTFARGGGNNVQLLVNFAVVLLCNPLPEVLYSKRLAGLEALSESLTFTQSYWVEWFLPFIVIISPMLVHGAKATLLAFGIGTELLPSFVLVSLGESIFPFIYGDIAGVVLLVWFTLFRGFLFNELNEGGLRRRGIQW